MNCEIKLSYCNRTSTRGTDTASQCRPTYESAPTCPARPPNPAGGSQRFRPAFRDGRAPAKDQPGREDDHRREDQIFDIGKVVVEALVARPERPARAGDSEAPERAAEKRQDREAAERHPDDTGRDRDERAYDRGHPAEEHSPVPVPREPAPGPR